MDEQRLEEDVAYRFAYLAQVMALTDRERALIRAARGSLRERLPFVVDAVRSTMLATPAMARHFADEGEVDPEVVGRHLRSWIEGLVARARDEDLPLWLDRGGAAHRAGAGDPRIDVPRVQMSALMGLLADCVLAEVAVLDLPVERRFEVARAFSKLLWAQNDLIQRHY